MIEKWLLGLLIIAAVEFVGLLFIHIVIKTGRK